MRKAVLVLLFIATVPVGSNPSFAQAFQVTKSAITVTISPQKSTLYSGETQVFVATVVGSGNQSVTWSIGEEGGGTVSSQGLYTAPKIQGLYHVTAASAVDPKKLATAAVTVLTYCDPPAVIAR